MALRNDLDLSHWVLIFLLILAISCLGFMANSYTHLASQVVTAQSQVKPPQVIVQPTQPITIPSRGVDNGITLITTAYSSGRLTCTGDPVGPGVIAVDPSVVPLHSILWNATYGYRYAIDTGGDIKGRRADLFMSGPTGHAQACLFGRQLITWKIVKRG